MGSPSEDLHSIGPMNAAISSTCKSRPLECRYRTPPKSGGHGIMNDTVRRMSEVQVMGTRAVQNVNLVRRREDFVPEAEWDMGRRPATGRCKRGRSLPFHMHALGGGLIIFKVWSFAHSPPESASAARHRSAFRIPAFHGINNRTYR